MGNNDKSNSTELNQVIAKLEHLEQRISRIENVLYLEKTDANKANEIANDGVFSNAELSEDELTVESKIGEYGLAWLGNIVMLFGIVFLTQYFNSLGFKLISSSLGFASAIGVFVLAKLLTKNYQNLASLFKITSYLLMYYFIFRLHFFIDEPLVSDKYIVVFMLLALNSYFYYLYNKLNNKLIGIIALVLILFTGLVSNLTLLCFIIFAASAYGSCYFFQKEGSVRLLIFSQIIIYLGMLIWIIGNPIAGNPIQLMSSNKYVFLFLFAIAGTYSTLAFKVKSENNSEADGVFGSIILNGFLFTILLAVYVLALFESHYIWIFLSLFVACLGFSALLKIKTNWKNIPALYALYSFMALSVAVFSYYKMPWAFFWLVIESLLVVSIALWFRAKVIIILNLLLFILLLLIALFSSETNPQIDFAFVFVALSSARIINWQKQRLDIKTEFIRNTYLIVAFFMMLYALYNSIPSQYITISWTIAAVAYFGMSLILKNVKYRYLAIATFISTAFYLFIIDLSKIELIFRVLAFMVLSILLLVVSIYYSKKRNAIEKK